MLGITHEAEKQARNAAALRQHDFDGEKHMRELYCTIGESACAAFRYKVFFRYLLDLKEGAVLWHCHTGKDRAGIAAALVLKVLGVDDETIYADYMRTNDFIEEIFCRESETLLSAMAEGPEKELRRKRYVAVFTGRPYYTDVFFDAFIHKYGSINEAFTYALGLTGEKIEQLKEMYLV